MTTYCLRNQSSDYYTSLAILLISLALITNASPSASNHHFHGSRGSENSDDALIASKPNPLISVPIDGGSQLEAKLNKTYRIHYICDLVSDWYDNIHLLAPYAFDCLIDNMRLIYNKTARTTRNSDGVQIRPTYFGSIDSVDYLVDSVDYLQTSGNKLLRDDNRRSTKTERSCEECRHGRRSLRF